MEIVFDQDSEKARDALYLIKNCGVSLEGCVLVLGGDGTMLKAMHQHNFKPVFLGLNCGHKGFLMNDTDGMLAKLMNKEFEVYRFPLLEIRTDSGWKGLAMDVYFNRISGKTCKVKVAVDGAVIAERIAGDGVVISTALGSSGYFVPAGGSAIHPKLQVICFAPIIRNTPFQIIPMVFPVTSTLEVTLLSPPEEVRGWYDSFDLPYPLPKKIRIKRAKQTLRLAFWKGENFTERLVRKIMKVQEG